MTGLTKNTLNVYGVKKTNFILLLFIKMPERPIPTTFLREFAIAELLGEKEIKKLYEHYHKMYKDNVQYYTEFVVALNWRLWYTYEKWFMNLAKLYDELWWEADLFAQDHFKWKDADYFFKYTD